MTDLDVYQPGAVDGYQARMLMNEEQARALDDQVRKCTEAVLREAVDYGVIPGTNGEKTLWRPGAQKLLQWFGLGYSCERVEVERDDQGRKHGITYRCTVGRRLPDGSIDVKATCEGTADYDESKFYQTAEEVQRKAKERETRNAEKYHRPRNPEKWQGLGEYRADWNALMKRAQKRAIVGAVVDATAAGGIFADREEDDHAAAPQDDGPSWYDEAIGRALVSTEIEPGGELQQLFVGAAQAHKQGLISRRQQDHIQNAVRQRLKLLQKTTTVVNADDAEQLAGQAASAQAEAEAPQEEPSTAGALDAAHEHADETPDVRHRELVGVVLERLEKLGVTEHGEQVWAAAKLARTTTESLHDLDDGELADVAHQLGKIRSRKRLEELMAAADEGGGDET